MQHFPYLIVGGGMTADAAAKAIREIDKENNIGIITSEPSAPYKRPPLTKGLWKGKPFESIWLGTENLNVDLMLRKTVLHLDVKNKRVLTNDELEYSFDKLLIATGGTPRRLPVESESIIYYRTMEDYQRLRQIADMKNDFVVIGGGFIGSEIAAALRMNNKNVIMIFPNSGIGSKIYPQDVSVYLNQYFRGKGVEVLPGETAEVIDPRGDSVFVRTKSGRDIIADGMVVGIGIDLNTGFAEDAGIEIENGIIVDEFLRAGHPNIYAAGDLANFFNPLLGKRLRVEHEDNAVTMGKYAGKAMAGDAERYDYLPYFYSDLFEIGYEAVGEMNPNMDIIADWKSQYEEGVIYYLRNGHVRGVLLWNVWNMVPEARKLIAEDWSHSKDSLKGRIHND